jgi:hypothetical protein
VGPTAPAVSGDYVSTGGVHASGGDCPGATDFSGSGPGARNDERRAVNIASLCRISEAGKRQPAVFFRSNRGVKSGLNFMNVIGPKRGPEESEDTQRLLTTRQHIIVCKET